MGSSSAKYMCCREGGHHFGASPGVCDCGVLRIEGDVEKPMTLLVKMEKPDATPPEGLSIEWVRVGMKTVYTKPPRSRWASTR